MTSWKNWAAGARRTLWGLGIGLLAVSLLLVWEPHDPPRFLLFLGRFHPLLVHFPIGILLLVALLEVVSRSRRLRSLQEEVGAILFLGGCSALLAGLVGRLRALEGGHDASLLFWHQWLGLGVAAGAFLAWSFHRAAHGRPGRRIRQAYRGTLAATLGALIVAGHLGGTLAHGPDYLTYHLPDSFKLLAGLQLGTGGGMENLQKARLFSDLVQPVLRARCASCHNPAKREGGLELDSGEGMLKGGEEGSVVVPGDPDSSELYRRITLPLFDPDHMPPEGREPLTVEETELIRWWIQQGASWELTVGQAREIPPAVQTTFNRLAAAPGRKKTGIYALQVDPPDPQAVNQLRGRGIFVTPLSQQEPFLDVQCSRLGPAFTDEDLRLLLPLASQIAWLDLAGTGISDEGLRWVGELKHLVRLHLENTSVTDRGLAHLAGLSYLEYLNLYGTGISDQGLTELTGLARLKSLYLWQTRASRAGVRQLEEKLPGLSVNLGEEGSQGVEPEESLTEEEGSPSKAG